MVKENKGLGASPQAATACSPTAEPPVCAGVSSASPLRPAGADAWRTDSPPFGKRPIWQYVWIQGSCEHSGHSWFRQGWGIAGIRTNDAEDGYLGYRAEDIARICRDNDIDIETARVVGWLPMTPPALLVDEYRPQLAPSDDGEWAKSKAEGR